MTDQADIETKFWKALKDDKTVMLGLAGATEAQPMTAQLLDDAPQGPIWFITSNESELAMALGRSHPALFHFAAKGHGLFASVEGELVAVNDRAILDKLWNPFVAAWFKDGKDDPALLMLRFEPGRAQIWLNENSVFAGMRILLGRDPKQDYSDKVASVRL